MNPRTTIGLFALLVVLVAAAFYLESREAEERTATGELLFPEYRQDEVDRVTLQKGGSGGDYEVVLQRQGDEWIVESEGGYPADQTLVDNILDKLPELRRTDLVSTQPDRHPTFETDTTGVEVKVSSGEDPVAWFTAGKAGPDFMSNYIRLRGEDEVYRVPVYLRSQVERGEASWRNKRLIDIEPENIASYTTRTPRDTVSVARGPEGNWQITHPFDAMASTDIMPVVAQSLARVTASGFADTLADLASVGLAQDTMNVEITTTEGETIKVVIGAENERRQNYSKRDDSDIVFLVPAGRWNTVFRSAEDLRHSIQATPGGGIEMPGGGPGTEAPGGGP